LPRPVSRRRVFFGVSSLEGSVALTSAILDIRSDSCAFRDAASSPALTILFPFSPRIAAREVLSSHWPESHKLIHELSYGFFFAKRPLVYETIHFAVKARRHSTIAEWCGGNERYCDCTSVEFLIGLIIRAKQGSHRSMPCAGATGGGREGATRKTISAVNLQSRTAHSIMATSEKNGKV
jgi:hypothetical protein